MMIEPMPAFSNDGIVQDVVVCANEGGQEREFAIGWDNSNQFFEGKGDIPRLFCEGGYAGAWTTFISSSLADDDPRRYYNGIIPTPEPTIEPTPSLEPEPTPTPSIEPEPTQTPTETPEPTIEPTPSPSPTLTPTMPATAAPVPVSPPTPTQLPEPTATPERSPEPTPTTTTEPPSEPTPTPTPIVEPSPIPIPSAPSQSEPTPTPTISQQVSIELSPTVAAIPGALQLVAAAEAIMNIGADMTDEEREEAQAVAVSALIVTQLAQVRKIK